ncbi:MAG TPA: PH domain-containing protein [Frankiaceae bacterium]|nr:PH domain-containing protein [Frankiaceae bacterium]
MTPERVEYAVPGWALGGLAAVTFVALVVAASAAPPGRFLSLVVAAAAGGEALRGALLRPTLAADAGGVEVVTGLRRERFPWAAVTNVAPMSPPSGGGRLRRRAAALEVDLGERLLVVPGYRLGTSVDEVAAEVGRLRGS